MQCRHAIATLLRRCLVSVDLCVDCLCFAWSPLFSLPLPISPMLGSILFKHAQRVVLITVNLWCQILIMYSRLLVVRVTNNIVASKRSIAVKTGKDAVRAFRDKQVAWQEEEEGVQWKPGDAAVVSQVREACRTPEGLESVFPRWETSNSLQRGPCRSLTAATASKAGCAIAIAGTCGLTPTRNTSAH